MTNMMNSRNSSRNTKVNECDLHGYEKGEIEFSRDASGIGRFVSSKIIKGLKMEAYITDEQIAKIHHDTNTNTTIHEFSSLHLTPRIDAKFREENSSSKDDLFSRRHSLIGERVSSELINCKLGDDSISRKLSTIRSTSVPLELNKLGENKQAVNQIHNKLKNASQKSASTSSTCDDFSWKTKSQQPKKNKACRRNSTSTISNFKAGSLVSKEHKRNGGYRRNSISTMSTVTAGISFTEMINDICLDQMSKLRREIIESNDEKESGPKLSRINLDNTKKKKSHPEVFSERKVELSLIELEEKTVSSLETVNI